MDQKDSFGSSGVGRSSVLAKPAQDTEASGWIAMNFEERRFGAGDWADLDSLFQLLKGKIGVSFRLSNGEEMRVVSGTLGT